MREIAIYIDICNANFKPGQLYETKPYYFNMACLRHMIKKKIYLLGNFSQIQ